jgi:sirohydrochlorin cobaltochelatase
MNHSQSTKLEKGLILIAHGSRLQQTADEMQAMIKSLQVNFSDTLILPAFMEIQQPDLKSTIRTLRGKGIFQINIIPLFFFTGKHMKADIPQQVEECRSEFVDCEINLQPCIGQTAAFIEALKTQASTL